MTRKILFVLSVIVLVSMSCQLVNRQAATPQPAVQPISTKEPAVANNQATATMPPTLPPTEPPAPTNTQPPDEPTATVEQSTPTVAGPVEYTETFDTKNDYWSETVIITTQAIGEGRSKYTVDKGVLTFNLADKETYAYKFFLYTVEIPLTIEVDFVSKGAQGNGIAIVCRADEAMTSWYEVRLSSNSRYNITRYDKARKTEQGKNPYVLLSEGVADIKSFFPAKPNHVAVTCNPDEILIDFNNGKKLVTQAVDTQIDGKLVGIGAMSYDVLPVMIEFDTVVVRQEE